MVGLSGAFGMICLCLWFSQLLMPDSPMGKMLGNMLANTFHLYVLLSGFALVIIAFTRGAILWRQSRDPKFAGGHHHDHDHHHDPGPVHEHAHTHHVHEGAPPQLAVIPAPAHVHTAVCDHDHKPGETCAHGHTHPHEHAVGTAHAHHDHDEADHDHGWAPWRYVVILVPVILFLLGLPDEGVKLLALDVAQTAIDYKQLILDFTAIIYEALPFIVLGVLVAGLLEEFVPQQAIAKIVPKNHILAIAIGGLLGLVFPMCECGIIVVMKRLLRKGLPLSVCVAYMLAGPVINAVVMTSTYVAFSGYDTPGRNDVLGGTWAMVGWRVGLSYLVACVTAIVVDWQWRRHGNALLHPSITRGLLSSGGYDDNGIAKRPWGERLNNITQTALHDFVDILAFLVLGALLAAGGKFAIKASNVQSFIEHTPAVAILLMMGIAVLFCLCSEADAFVAANFPLFWPDGSKLAFLVLGPMLDLKLILMYTRVFRGRLIATIVACLVVQVFGYTTTVQYFFGKTHPKEQAPFVMTSNLEAHIFSVGLAGGDIYSQFAHCGGTLKPAEASGKGIALDYKTLEGMAAMEDLRKHWENKIIEVRGQYKPTRMGKQQFNLVRIKINCCASDAIELKVPMVSREPITAHEFGDWVKVTGRVEFRQVAPEKYMTVVVISAASDVVKLDSPEPYIQ